MQIQKERSIRYSLPSGVHAMLQTISHDCTFYCIDIQMVSHVPISFYHEQILSTSGDGKVLLWQPPSQGSPDLKLVGGYLLQTGAVPRSMRVSKAKGDAEMGGMLLCSY